MRKQLLAICFVLFSGVLFAQSPIGVGESQLNIGTGFSSWGLPFYVGADFGVHPDITVGGELSFQSFDRWDYHHNVMGIVGNGNYHFNTILNIPSNWDFYAGLNLGIYIWNSDEGYTGSKDTGLGLSAQVGGRYYWNDRWGINLEFNGGSAFDGAKIGISVKL